MSRSSGRSATSASAYRSGTCITDHRTGELHDYRNKGINGVESSGIILPKNSPEELHNRENLWNAAEQSENRKNSVVAREVMVAIPHELNKEQREELVKNYSQSLSDRYKTGVDYSIHNPDKGGDDRNHHAHIMMTTRRIDEKGFGEKTRELDAYKSTGKMEINNIRQSWEEHANKSLEKAGQEQRIDSRSLQDQGIDRQPQQHVGVAGTAIDRRGEFSERAELNKEIRALNNERIQTLKELKSVHAEQRELKKEIGSLYGERKEAFKEHKQAERLDKAVDDARGKTFDIHNKSVENYEKYRSYHHREIIKVGKRLDEVSDQEPKKRFWQTQKSHDKKHESWSEKSKEEYAKAKQDIEKHSEPKYSQSVDRAAGQSAYENKVKKSEIKEHYHGSEAKMRVQDADYRKQQIQEKLDKRIEKRNENFKSIDAKSTKVDELKAKIADKKQQLSDNSQEARKGKNQDSEVANKADKRAPKEAISSKGAERKQEQPKDSSTAKSSDVKENSVQREQQSNTKVNPQEKEQKSQVVNSNQQTQSTEVKSSLVESKQEKPIEKGVAKSANEKSQATDRSTDKSVNTNEKSVQREQQQSSGKEKTHTEPQQRQEKPAQSEQQQQKNEALKARLAERQQAKSAEKGAGQETDKKANEPERTPAQQNKVDALKEKASEQPTKESKGSEKNDGLGY